MKILMINKISPEFGGGAELLVKEIGERLNKNGHDIFLLTASESAHSPDFALLDGIYTYYLPRSFRMLYRNERLRYLFPRYSFYILSLPFIAKFARQLDVDIIHDYASPIPSSATFVGHRLDIPTIMTVHEILFARAFDYYDPITAVAKLLGECLTRAVSPNYVIAVSSFTKRMLLRLGIDEEKISVIPNGVDCQKFHPLDNFEDSDNLSVVCVNRLVPQKRISHVLLAAKRVVREIPTVNFYIIGKGKLENKLRTMVSRMRLDRNVHILGFLPQDVVIRYLQRSTVFVTTSRQEGFGIAAAEAMACGIPVISYDVPALNELIRTGRDGLLVKDGNIEQLSQAIIRLLKNSEIAEEYGRRASRKIREKYDWNEISRQVLDAYRKAIA